MNIECPEGDVPGLVNLGAGEWPCIPLFGEADS